MTIFKHAIQISLNIFSCGFQNICFFCQTFFKWINHTPAHSCRKNALLRINSSSSLVSCVSVCQAQIARHDEQNNFLQLLKVTSSFSLKRTLLSLDLQRHALHGTHLELEASGVPRWDQGWSQTLGHLPWKLHTHTPTRVWKSAFCENASDWSIGIVSAFCLLPVNVFLLSCPDDINFLVPLQLVKFLTAFRLFCSFCRGTVHLNASLANRKTDPKLWSTQLYFQLLATESSPLLQLLDAQGEVCTSARLHMIVWKREVVFPQKMKTKPNFHLNAPSPTPCRKCIRLLLFLLLLFHLRWKGWNLLSFAAHWVVLWYE